jgi:hypothetical protein
MSLTLTTTGLVNVTDSNLNSPQSPISFGQTITVNAVDQISSFTVGTVSTAAVLPVTPVLFASVKNNDPVIPVAVTWTKTGGSAAGVITLQPADYIQFCDTSGGITALSFSATATMTVAMVLAG